jgi:hypothetical protein
MVSAASAPASDQRISFKRLLWVAPLAIVVSVIATQLVRLLFVALFDISPEFMPLQFGPPLAFTIMGVLGAVIVFAAVGRLSRRPIQLFRTIAVIVLVLSFLPDIGLLMTGMMPGTSPIAVAGLALMHVVVWAITVWMLTTLARE